MEDPCLFGPVTILYTRNFYSDLQNMFRSPKDYAVSKIFKILLSFFNPYLYIKESCKYYVNVQ